MKGLLRDVLSEPLALVAGVAVGLYVGGLVVLRFVS